MRKIIILILITIFSNSYAQKYDFNIGTYDWDNSVINYVANQEDQKYSSVMISAKDIYQYLPDDKNGLKKYRCLHNIHLLNDDKSIEDNNKIYFSVNDRDAIKQVKVRVIENGKVLAITEMNDMKVVNEDGNNYLLLAIKGMKKGCIIETLLIIENDLDLYGTNYVQKAIPVKNYEFQLMVPSHLIFKTKVYNYTTEITDSLYNEQWITYLKFNNLPAYEEELNSLGNGNKVRIEYTYYKNTANNRYYTKYAEAAKSHAENIFSTYDQSIKKLDPILKKLNLTDKSEEEKIFLIENYIKTNYEFKKGIQSSLVDELIKNKYGNQYSINRLLCFLLRRANIKFELVLTCSKEDKLFDDNFESLAYLNNTLLYFPAINKYLDTEYTLTRVGKISTEFLSQSSIHTKFIELGGNFTGVSYNRLIPKNTDEEGTSYENYQMKVNTQNNTVNVSYKREFHGYADQNLRAAYYIRNDEAKKELIEGFVKGMANDGVVKNIQVENFEINDYKKFKSPFVISADVESTHFIEDGGDKLLLNIGEVIGLQQELYNTKPRVNPIDINFVHLYKRKIILDIPENYELKGLEKLNMNNVFIDHNNNQSLGFTSRYEIVDNKLVIYCDEYYKDIHYPLSMYENYKTVINSAADFNKISILLVKKG